MCLCFGWVYVPQWEPLFKSFIEVGGKLEELGFRYNKGSVMLVPIEEVA